MTTVPTRRRSVQLPILSAPPPRLIDPARTRQERARCACWMTIARRKKIEMGVADFFTRVRSRTSGARGSVVGAEARAATVWSCCCAGFF